MLKDNLKRKKEIINFLDLVFGIWHQQLMCNIFRNYTVASSGVVGNGDPPRPTTTTGEGNHPLSCEISGIIT